AVAALLDAGYRVVLADFDGNSDPLRTFPKNRENLHILPFEDELESGQSEIEGAVKRVNKTGALRQFTRFLTVGNEGLGKPRSWGDDTVFVLDSLTTLGDSAVRMALALNGGKTMEGQHIGIAMRELDDALDMVKQLRCHRYVIAHLKLIAPKPVSAYNEHAVNKEIKAEVAALQETAFFANLPGNALSRVVASKFPCAVLFEVSDQDKLVIRTKPM